jgi:TM2 domain-containing membrane protein YozV
MRSSLAASALLLLLGFLGGRRFYTGKVRTGVFFAMTFGFLGFGWFIGVFTAAFENLKDRANKDNRPRPNTS